MNGIEAFQNKQLFPTTKHVIEEIHSKDNEITSGRRNHQKIRKFSENPDYIFYHGHLLTGKLDPAKEKGVSEIETKLDDYEEKLSIKFRPMVIDSLFNTVANFLCTQGLPVYNIR